MSVLLSCQNWRVKWATPVLFTNVTDERPSFIPCTLLCAHESHSPHVIHPSPTLLFEYTLRTIQPWRRHCFCFELTLPSSPLYLSLAILLFFLVTTCTRLGSRLILPSPVATYKCSIEATKVGQLAAKVSPRCPTLAS